MKAKFKKKLQIFRIFGPDIFYHTRRTIRSANPGAFDLGSILDIGKKSHNCTLRVFKIEQKLKAPVP